MLRSWYKKKDQIEKWEHCNTKLNDEKNRTIVKGKAVCSVWKKSLLLIPSSFRDDGWIVSNEPCWATSVRLCWKSAAAAACNATNTFSFASWLHRWHLRRIKQPNHPVGLSNQTIQPYNGQVSTPLPQRSPRPVEVPQSISKRKSRGKERGKWRMGAGRGLRGLRASLSWKTTNARSIEDLPISLGGVARAKDQDAQSEKWQLASEYVGRLLRKKKAIDACARDSFSSTSIMYLRGH